MTFTRASIQDRSFFLAGRATFTVEVPKAFTAKYPDCQDHYTFKIVKKEGNERWPAGHMVLMLTGPDNESDYTYVGKLDGYAFRLTHKSKLTADSWPKKILDRVLAVAASNDLGAIERAGWKLMHEGRCCRCGRKLTVPASIEAGIGPECAGRVS